MGTDGDLDIEMMVVVVMVVVGGCGLFSGWMSRVKFEANSKHLSKRVMAFPAVAFPSGIITATEMSKPTES